MSSALLKTVLEVFGRQAAGYPEVDRGHDGIVETIGIDMDPETIELAAA